MNARDGAPAMWQGHSSKMLLALQSFANVKRGQPVCCWLRCRLIGASGAVHTCEVALFLYALFDDTSYNRVRPDKLFDHRTEL